MPLSMQREICKMGRDLVTNLKFKKISGSFDPEVFGKMIDEAYTAGRNTDRWAKKHTFSPSTVGYGYGTCPRYWFIAFNGADFEDNFDAMAIANMENGKQAHDRIQTLLQSTHVLKEIEREIFTFDCAYSMDCGKKIKRSKFSDTFTIRFCLNVPTSDVSNLTSATSSCFGVRNRFR